MLAAAAAVLLLSGAPARAAARAPKTLTVCDDVRDPLTLDPQKEFSEKNHTIVQQVFEGLVRLGPDGKIQPALATSWRRLDPLTVRFRLRRGVRFQDGETFDAESVRYSIARYLDPKTGFPARGFLAPIERAVVVDSRTVDVVTSVPDGLLLNRLAGFVVMVPPRRYATTPESVLAAAPVGTGPFRFVRWDRGRDIVLERNPGYWGRGLPKLDRLVFAFLPARRQVDALLSGRVDLLTSLPGTRTLEVQRSTQAFVIKRPTFYTVAANFDASRPPLSDERVREALNLAVDRQALVRYDLLGNGVPIATLSLPGEPGHDAALRPYPYDPARARRLLAEAGYPEGFALKVLLKRNAERTGRILAAQLARVGVRLEPVLTSDAELFTRLQDRGFWGLAVYDCPDPMADAFFIRSIFLSGKSPFSLAPDAGYDARETEMTRTLDDGRRRALSEALDDYVHDRYLALPTYQRVRTYGVRRGVEFTPAVTGMPYFSGADVHEPAAR